ncbi:MAG: aminopeptidase N [Pseudonocardiaceae bacterium]
MPSLTRAEAARRGALLNIRSYHVELDLTTGDEVFRSSTTIAFDAADTGGETFLDVNPKTLHSVLLNGAPVDVTALTQGRLPLTGLAADNEIVVTADMSYSKDCEGLHRYVDPADGRVYLYAFVYIDNAPRVFACFDQPDLKASYTFTVTAPEDWQVLGNGEATQVGPGRWELAPTPPQSTYLTTLVAGPYESFHHDHDGIRLGLHCRASLAGYLKDDVAEVFEVTGQCLDAYEWWFGVRYPFGKLDQVFVPEFSILSLDHPACVLLREMYLFRTPGTASERETRAVVVAHGISLMWLAGLVTNAWWDDLWLGQAFADYMAHRVTSEATRFPGPPTTFAARRKGQAYVADQRPSTHPVSIEGSDVQSVLLDLDRISYFKGHSAIRQLAHRVGTTALRSGLRTYFARHAYSTVTDADFLAALSEATGTDMTGWAGSWFKESNVNTLHPEITIRDGRISAAAIRQTAPDSHPILRPHTLNVGLYGVDDTTVRIDIDGERTELPALVGRAAPELVLLNDGDLTYAKIRFDPQSLAALPDVLPRLSPLNRAMVWCQLLLAVQDGAFPPARHLELVTRMLATESELSIITEVLEQARHDVADRFLAPTQRPGWLALIAGSLRQRLARTEAGDERQITLYRNLIDFTADVTELRSWLDRSSGLAPGLVVDADISWRIRYRLAVLGAVSESEIAAAYTDDPSAQGMQFATKCRAARPDPAAKRAAWDTIMTDDTLSNYEFWSLAEGFWQPEQLELTAPYVERFFTGMPGAAKLRGDLVLDMLVRFLYPRYAVTTQTLRFADQMLGRVDIPLPLRRRVADFTDDLRRVINARAVAG